MIAAIIQARMGSTRLPGKILKDLAGKPMLWHVVERVRAAKKVDKIIVATTTNPEDDKTVQFCEEHNIPYYRGSAENVLERYFETARAHKADAIVRITGDCPLIAPEIIDICVDAFRRSACDYISNMNPGPRTFPRGLDVEVLSSSALGKAYTEARENYEKEHVTPYIWENKGREFRLGKTIVAPHAYARAYRLTVDYPEDFAFMETLYGRLWQEGTIVHVPDVVKLMADDLELQRINAHCVQKDLRLTQID